MSASNSIWTGKGFWLKGNTHVHTTNSDGVCTAAEIGAEYGRRGYDFVFLTDHYKRTVPGSSINKPLLIPAEEIDFSHQGYCYHYVCLGLQKQWERGTCLAPDQVLRRARRENVFIVQAHPYWCGTPSARCVFSKGSTCPGVEVYNKVCDRLNAKGYANVHWDDLLDAGHHVLGFAADDAHLRSDIGCGWIMVKAVARTPGSILAAIRSGRFYATQGPALKNIVVRGRTIKVVCSPAARINFISNRNQGVALFAEKAPLKKAAWKAPAGSTYVRVEIVEASGKTAWSNPIFF